MSMATMDELQKHHEARLSSLVQELAGGGQESDLALARALIHKGVHLAIERRAGEFCALATFLCEMVGHAHGLMHGPDTASGKHN
jgi:muconolactone delta-isomerase